MILNGKEVAAIIKDDVKKKSAEFTTNARSYFSG